MYVITVKEWEFPSNIRRSIYILVIDLLCLFKFITELAFAFVYKEKWYIPNEDELCNLMVFCCMFALQSAYYKWLYWMSYWIFIDFACCIL